MNPYKMLGVGKDASKHEIVLGMTTAMREKKYSARELAEAQKALLNSVTKTAYEFINFINIAPFLEEKKFSVTHETKKSESLKLLNIF